MQTAAIASEERVPALGPAVAGLLALGVLIGIGRFVYTPILPLMGESLGWSKLVAGGVASTNFAGYLAGALFAVGALPGSRSLWLLGSLVASSATTGVMGLTRAVPLFLALRFAGGVASAIGLILVSAIVLEALAQARRREFSSILFAGVGCGIAISAALVSGLRATGASWQELWFASGALSLAGTVSTALLLPREPEAGSEVRQASANAPAGGLASLIVAYGLFGFGYVITATFLVAIVRGNAVLRLLEPEIWIVFGLAAVPSVALWSGVGRWIGVSRGYALACLVEAAGVAVSVAWRTEAGAFLAAVLVGGTFMGLTSLGLIRGRLFGGGDARRALALMTSAFGLGQIIGPSFAGALYDRLGSFAVPSGVAAAALMLAAALTGLGQRG